MDTQLSPKQRALVEQAEALAMENFAPRAADLDRKAAFPFEDFADLAGSGLLGLCVPESSGGSRVFLTTWTPWTGLGPTQTWRS